MNVTNQDLGQAAPKQMLTLEYTPTGYKVKINPSSLTVIQTCPKKAFYSLYNNLVPNVPSTATTFGSAIHKALEIFYAAPREERQLVTNYKKNIDLMCHGQELPDESSSLIYRATRGFISEAQALASLPDTDMRSIVNGGWLLSHYYETRINDPYEIYKNSEGESLVEQTYTHPIHSEDGLDIELFGTIDAILENKANGQIVVCDHKTTSSTNMNDFYNRTKPNHQYTAYIYLAQKCLNLTTENFMINCFQVKNRPKTSRGSGPNFLHLITKRSPEDINDFIKTTVYYVKEYIKWVETGYWPYGPVDACANYGRCSFLDVCSAPESIKENLLSANYTNKYGDVDE